MNETIIGTVGDNYGLSARPRARTLGKQLFHMCKVRYQWLTAIKPKQDVIKPEDTDLESIRKYFESSTSAIENLIKEEEQGEKITGVKSVLRFVSYLISHESHHRGQIMLILKLNGIEIDKKAQFSLWKW